MYSLGVSAIVTGRYLSMNLQFGDEETLNPEFVESLTVTLKNKENLELRTFETNSEFSNNDGCFKMGTVLFDEETPTKVYATAKTTLGNFQASCDVSTQPDTITSQQF